MYQSNSMSLMVFGLLDRTRPTSSTPRGDHLSTRRVRQRRSLALLNGPIRFPHTFSVSTITDGNARIGGAAAPFLPLRRSDCTLSRLRAEEYDRPVTQSIATPEPSSRTIPTQDQVLVTCESLECHHTREPTVLARVSCRPSQPEC